MPKGHPGGGKKPWGRSSHDRPWLRAQPCSKDLLLGCASTAGARSGMHRKDVALGSSRKPPCPGEGPWQVLGGGARFPRRGGRGSEQVWESGAVLAPPAPFTAQTVTWFMAAEGHCTGSINPVSQRLLPGKLAPVQSRQEGLAALCRERARTASSVPSSVARWDLGYPLHSASTDKGGIGNECPAWESPRLPLLLPK